MTNKTSMQNPELHAHMTKLFKEYGYTQLEICEQIGISPAYLSQAIRQSCGKHLTPNVLLAISELLNLDYVEVVDIMYLATLKSTVISIDVSDLTPEQACDIYCESYLGLAIATE